MYHQTNIVPGSTSSGLLKELGLDLNRLNKDGARVDIEIEKLRKLSEEFARKKISREESPIVNEFDESTHPTGRFRRSFSTDAGYTSDRGSDCRSVDRQSISPTRSLYNGSESGRKHLNHRSVDLQSVSPTRSLYNGSESGRKHLNRRSVDRQSVSPTHSLYNGSESGRKHSKEYTFHRCCSSSERDASTCEVHNPGRCSAQERWQNSLRRSSSRCRSRSPSLDRSSRRSSSRSRRSSSRPRRSSSRSRRRSVSRSPSPNQFRRSVGRSSRSPSPRNRYSQRGGRTPSPDHIRGRSPTRSYRSPSRSPSPTFSVRSSYSVRSFRTVQHSGSRSPDRKQHTYHKCCGRDCSPDSSSCAVHNKNRLSRSLSRTRSSPHKSSSKSPSRIPHARRSLSRSPERSRGRNSSRSPPRGTSAPRTFRRSSSRSPSRESCIINHSHNSTSNNNKTDDYKYNNYSNSNTPLQNYYHINNNSPNSNSYNNKQNGLPPIVPNSRKDSKTEQGDQNQHFLPQTLPDLISYKMPSQRRYSEDNFRKPLATLHEDEVVARRRYSEDVRKKSFDTSAVEDEIYKHQRKLSEAGVRRLSDASVILTEDTDSFIIGDRVWVGGTKGGNISYIGETKFAPGDWAGITLDDTIGKNDGSVGGIRYFQCESKKGVFSRLTRLSRVPLTDQDIEAMASKSSSPSRESPKRNGTNTSVTSGPTGGRSNSTSSVLSTPAARKVSPAPNAKTPATKSSSPMTASAIRKSSPSPVSGELKIGDRVVINSTTGPKFGVLQYRGKTEFADGEWAGIEMDEPNGKNDGSVAGKRYFEGKQRYGLFAPIARVSRFTGGSATSRRSSIGGTRKPSRTSTGGSSHLGPSTKVLQDDDGVWDDDGFY